MAFGVKKGHRDTFLTWAKGAYPAVVFEITSKTTRAEDRRKKIPIYRDEWKVREYFLFDPRWEYLTPPLQGHRLVDGQFEPIPIENGALTSTVLGLKIERDRHLLRLTDTATGKIVLTEFEAKAEAAERQLRAEHERAEAALAELAAPKAELARRNP